MYVLLIFFFVHFKDFRQRWRKLKSLGKNFVENKISAAGISYIVKEKSQRRRYLWIVGVLFCLTFMGYMTVNVISEYQSYPKMLIQEVSTMKWIYIFSIFIIIFTHICLRIKINERTNLFFKKDLYLYTLYIKNIFKELQCVNVRYLRAPVESIQGNLQLIANEPEAF